MYSRIVDDQLLTIAPSGWTYDNTFVLYDRESETLWYPYRRGLRGIQGKHFNKWLEIIASHDISWGEWNKRYPESKILK